MNKLFSKIAALSVGLAMAVGVGVALGHQGVKEAKATEVIAYTLNGTITTSGTNYAGENDVTQDAISWKVNGNVNQNPWRVGGNQKNGLSKAGTVRHIQSQLAVTSEDITKVVVTTSLPSKNALEPINVSLKVGTSIGGSQTSLLSNEGWGTSVTFDRPNNADWSSKFFEIDFTMPANTTDTNKFVCVESVEFYCEVSGQQISAPSFTTVAVGKTVEVEVSYTNIGEGGITVTSDDNTIASVPAKLNVSGTGSTTLEITGERNDVTSVTLSAGSAEVSITVNVINPDYYYLVDNINYLTPSSEITLIAEHNSKLYYINSFNSNGYFDTDEVPVVGEGFVGAEGAFVFTLEMDEQGHIFILDSDGYVGATSVTSSAKLTITEEADAAYNIFTASQVQDSNKFVIEFDTTDGTAKRINYNSAYGRIANYSSNNASLLYIYSKELKPYVYNIPGQQVVASDSFASITPAPVNFGGETVNYSFNSSDSEVATASYEGGQIKITGVAAGNATITITAQSENHGPVVKTVAVEVYDSARELESITIDVSEETLCKRQEFSYSGTVTANYSNGDHEPVTNVSFSGYDMSVVGDCEVTVSYTEEEVTKTATYTLHVVQWEGALKLGSYYVIYSEYEDKDSNPFKQALTGVASNLGVASSYTTTLKSEFALYVEEGSEYNSYALKTSDGKYLAAANSNNLYANAVEEKTADVSWTVTAVDETHYTIANVAYPSRSIQCNHNNGNPRFAAYGSTQKAVSLVEVTTTEIASNFETNYMHPEISTDNHEDTNACRAEGEGAGSYYAYAKVAFNVMPEASRNYFLTNSEYAARLSAWAVANGEELDSSNLLAPAVAESFYSDADLNNNSYIIIIVISSVSVLSFGLALFLRKKRSK